MFDTVDTLLKLVSRSCVPVVRGLFDLVVNVIPIYKAQLHRSSLDVLQLTLCSKCLCPVSSVFGGHLWVGWPPATGIFSMHGCGATNQSIWIHQSEWVGLLAWVGVNVGGAQWVGLLTWVGVNVGGAQWVGLLTWVGVNVGVAHLLIESKYVWSDAPLTG